MFSGIIGKDIIGRDLAMVLTVNNRLPMQEM